MFISDRGQGHVRISAHRRCVLIIKSCYCDSKTNLRSVSSKVSEKYCFKAQPRVYVQDLTLIYSLLTLHYFILYIVHLNVDLLLISVCYVVWKECVQMMVLLRGIFFITSNQTGFFVSGVKKAWQQRGKQQQPCCHDCTWLCLCSRRGWAGIQEVQGGVWTAPASTPAARLHSSELASEGPAGDPDFQPLSVIRLPSEFSVILVKPSCESMCISLFLSVTVPLPSYLDISVDLFINTSTPLCLPRYFRSSFVTLVLM